MRTTIFIWSIVFLSFSLSCKKKAADINPDYIGFWSGDDSDKYYRLSITSESRGVYRAVSYDGDHRIKVGGKARIDGNTLKILTKKLTIDQPPQQDPSDPKRYTLVLDGVVYERY
ncbi:hypothetical protein D3C87_85010 [compost metagenome]